MKIKKTLKERERNCESFKKKLLKSFSKVILKSLKKYLTRNKIRIY